MDCGERLARIASEWVSQNSQTETAAMVTPLQVRSAFEEQNSTRLVNVVRDVRRPGAFGSPATKQVLVKYSEAVNKGCDVTIREQAVQISKCILRGDLDDDAASMWLLGIPDKIRYQWAAGNVSL